MPKGFASSSSHSSSELESKINQLSVACGKIEQLSAACVGLHKQIQQQNEILELQGKKIERLTELLGNSAKNLLDMKAAKSGAYPARDHFVPTLELVENQVNHICQLDNDTLMVLAVNGDGFAARERLIREIMTVDKCSWDDAHRKLIAMDQFNERFYWLETLPYRCGITLGFFGAIAACLVVFVKPTALFYAENVAGESLPEEVEDISTMTTNQVGTWTWAWAEPMIGVASFVLLCMQLVRSQAINMNMSAYTRWMLMHRAERVAHKYPQYTPAMVRAWAVQLPRVNWTFTPEWKRCMYTAENRKKNFRLGVDNRI